MYKTKKMPHEELIKEIKKAQKNPKFIKFLNDFIRETTQ